MHACIQAHLFDAKQLQRACLAFIKENLEAVAITPGPLHRKWGSLFAYFSFSLILFCSILAADDTCNTSIWVESHCEFEVSEAHYRLARSDAESHPLQCRLSTNWMWLLTSQFLDHLYLLGSQKVIGLQRFAGVLYVHIYIYRFLFFDFVGGGCSASAGLSDSSTGPVVDAQRESLRGLKRKRFEWFEMIWKRKWQELDLEHRETAELQ